MWIASSHLGLANKYTWLKCWESWYACTWWQLGKKDLAKEMDTDIMSNTGSDGEQSHFYLSLEHSTVCWAYVTVIKTQVVWRNCCWLWEDEDLGSLMALEHQCQACLIMPSFHSCLMKDTASTNRGGRDERARKEKRKEERSWHKTADRTQNACVHFWRGLKTSASPAGFMITFDRWNQTLNLQNL